jgi:stage V sporulation protein K
LKKQNPISFLEHSFISLKEYLESEPNTSKPLITKELIINLERETRKVLAFCAALNKDDLFVARINAQLNRENTNGLLKAEQFFIADLIKAYQLKAYQATPISRFVLAYYYDAIRNNQFADVNHLSSLNKLVVSDEFEATLIKIQKDNVLIKANESQAPYFLLSTFAQQKDERISNVLHYIEIFFRYAHQLEFANTKALNDFLGFSTETAEKETELANAVANDDSLAKVLNELNELVGLENVKKDINELINLLEIQKHRTKQGLKNIEITLHTVFLGPPGTGKTSVARLLGRIFKHLGFLSKGQLRETDREGMVAGYVGQTATKVDQIIAESVGGVLFIDEAYSLTQGSLGNDYGAEAISTLLKRMEDKRDDLVVVVAGYTEPMKFFLESNLGLNSRFNRFFHFKHFSPSELFQIFENFSKKSDFVISDEAKEKLNDTFELLYAKKDEGFGNARVVRNLFEKCVQNQANRIIKLKEINYNVLKTFEQEDIPEPKETEKNVYFSDDEDQSS